MNKIDYQNIEVLILCGGFGTRLKSVAINGPKPMAPIGDRPFLDHIFFYLTKFGFKNFCFLTGHKGDILKAYFEDKKFSSYQIRFSHEETPLGTGGAIKKAIEHSKQKHYLVLNGDTFFGINYNNFLSSEYPDVHRIALFSVEDASRYGSVKINADFYVSEFVEKKSKSQEPKINFINGGVYYLNKSILQFFESDVCSLESDIFPKLLIEKQLIGVPLVGRFIDIGIPADYYFACDQLSKWIAELT
jgi:NDP-sugar pyrophosphorylase family protein